MPDEWPPGCDILDNAALAAQVERGPERLLACDRAALRRGVEGLRAGREHSARYTLSAACRRTAMFTSPDEAAGRLLEAADAAGADYATVLRQALLGVLEATTPKL